MRHARVAAAACAGFLAIAACAHANTIAVNTVADPSAPGKCTLREAITAANTNTAVGACAAGSPYPAVDTINIGFIRAICLFSDCTIVLTSPLPAISEDVTLHGVSNLMTISGNNLYRIFDLQGVGVNIDTLNLVNGKAFGAGTSGYGAAINTSDTLLTLASVTLSGNHAQSGGGAMNVSHGVVSVTNSRFVGNTVDYSGGAIYQSNGVLILNGVTISANSAAADGGGLEVQSLSDTRITNVTFSGNSASRNGGAISRIGATYNVTLNNVTITANTADADNDGFGDGGGIHRAGGAIVFSNSIIAGNFDTPGNAGPGTKQPDCIWLNGDSVLSTGYNLVGSADECPGFVADGDRTGTNAAPLDPGLAPLASNGGFTQTHALLTGSLAKNTASPAMPGALAYGACVGTDQRGTPRPGGPICDKGAYEDTTAPAPFTDDPLVPQVTVITAGQIVELRNRIDYLRSLYKLSAFPWTDPTLTAGMTIRVQHVIDLRHALQDAFEFKFPGQPYGYTDPVLNAGAAVKAIHISEARNYLRSLE